MASIKCGYDAENRLTARQPTSVRNGNQRVEFTYDHRHRRVENKVFTRGGGQWNITEHRKFVYYGNLLIGEIDVTDGSPPTETVMRTYIDLLVRDNDGSWEASADILYADSLPPSCGCASTGRVRLA